MVWELSYFISFLAINKAIISLDGRQEITLEVTVKVYHRGLDAVCIAVDYLLHPSFEGWTQLKSPGIASVSHCAPW